MHINYFVDFDPVKAILPSPFEGKRKTEYRTAHSKRLFELEIKSACFKDWCYIGDKLPFVEVYCAEHRRKELIPNGSHDDFRWWYDVGLHPRFSITRTLFEAGQLMSETGIGIFSETMGRDLLHVRINGTGMTFREILRKSRTPREFLKLIGSQLFVNLYFRRRRYRVRSWFRDKFRARSFTRDDYFSVQNQELRRLMVNRGVFVRDVLKSLKFVAKDEEGVLYEAKEWPHSRYLYVKCPSTDQEYLLGVPSSTRDGTPINSPKEARRWTFGLPVDVEFAQEA